jgi:pimeloyl-ACP methyl ester carboxylesterase
MRLKTRVCVSLMVFCALSMLSSAVWAKSHGNGACAPYYNSSIKVDRLEFPVTLSDGQHYTVVGYLYYKGSLHSQDKLQVAAHGGTYTHEYWDAPCINGQPYSYARYMARNDYAVLAIDAIGAGESSKPDGDFVSIGENAKALAQVINSMRTRHNPSHKSFNKIGLVGHSLGSMTSAGAIGNEGADVDAVAFTGWNHTAQAGTDPSIYAIILATPYVLWPDFLRNALFYLASATDPAVQAYDNANISTPLPRGMILSASYVGPDPQLSGGARVDVPVLLQIGDQDLTFDPNASAAEFNYMPLASSIDIDIIPNAGHNLNLQRVNQTAWAHALDFFDDQLSSHGCGHH